MGLVIYTLAAFGVAYVLGHAMITRGLREWAYGFHFGKHLVSVEPEEWKAIYPLRWLIDMIECPACLGFHTGFWTCLLWFGRVSGWHSWQRFTFSIVAAFYTAGTNYLLGKHSGLMPDKGEQ